MSGARKAGNLPTALRPALWVPRKRETLTLALIVAVSVLSRAVWFGDPAPDSDEQLYSLIGARMLHGELPYTDWWDRKPFGLFALFALAHALGGPGPIAYQLLATAFIAAGAWLLYRLASILADHRTATGVALLYPLLMYAYGNLSGQSEAFFNPLMLGALLLIIRLKQDGSTCCATGAMFLAGLALQVKYSVLPQCLFLGLAALWHFRWEPPLKLFRRTMVLLAAGLSPTLAVALLYAVQSEFPAFWYANFESIFARSAAQSGRFPHEHLAPLTPLFALTAGGLYLAFRTRPEGLPRNYLLVIGWTLSILAGIYMLTTVYLYYFAALVPAALLLAIPLLDVRRAMRWLPLAIVSGGAAALLNLPRHFVDTRQARGDLARMVVALKPYVGRDRCLFVFDGPAALYRMTGSCLPARVIYPDHLNNPLERNALPVGQAREVARVLASPAGAVVTADQTLADRTTPARRLVAETIEREYRPLISAVIRGRTFRAFVPNQPRQQSPRTQSPG